MLPLPEAAPLRLELAALQRGALHGAWRWSLMRLQPHHVNATFSSSAPFIKIRRESAFSSISGYRIQHRASSQCLTLSGAPRPTSTTDIIIPSNQNQQQASLRAYGPHPKSGTRAMALRPLMPRPRRTAAPHVCTYVLPQSPTPSTMTSSSRTDQNARQIRTPEPPAITSDGATPPHATHAAAPFPCQPCQPTRRALLVQMACARGDARGSVGSLHPDVGRSLLGGGLGRLRLGGASNRCFVIV